MLAGPSATPINVTSLTITIYAASGEGIQTFLYGAQLPSSATSCDSAGLTYLPIWRIVDLGDGSTPQTFTFPTPLQLKPTSGVKVCLKAGTSTNRGTLLNAVGFYS